MNTDTILDPAHAADLLRLARETHDAAFAAFAAELHRTGVVPADGTAVADAYTAADEAFDAARAAYRAARNAAR